MFMAKASIFVPIQKMKISADMFEGTYEKDCEKFSEEIFKKLE